MLWGCFAFNGTGECCIIDGRIDSQKYQDILEANVERSIQKLNIGPSFHLQRDNNPKLTSKSTKKFFSEKNWTVLEWPSHYPDLNPIEMLWSDLKKMVHARSPKNLTQLKDYALEEWSKIDKRRCQTLIDGYHKRLQAVIVAKGGATKY